MTAVDKVKTAMENTKPPKTERKKREAKSLPTMVAGEDVMNYAADALFTILKSKREELANLDEKKKNLPLEIAALKKEIDRRKGA